MSYPEMNPNDKKDWNVLTVVVSFIVVLIALIPFVKNFKYNDYHLNWLNHDYGKNLMISTEQNSVLMTEGGDNQVFATVYFIYAEKLRPDITPYDQKGNIFNRIYGDMRYITPEVLQHRMKLVDTYIFAGYEPFYKDIRDMKDPYFIPYWIGTRPVYLTWERPEPWTLGDYYYHRYGIMYKVQHIEYALVDYLELVHEIPFAAAQKKFSDWLHKSVDMKYTMDQIDSLVAQGYVAKSGGMVKFVKMYPSPHDTDYFSDFLIRWKDIKNAQFLDYLTREIVINYDYQMGEIYLDRINELQVIKSSETRPDIIKELDNHIWQSWTNALTFFEEALYYGHDSISVLHNIAVIYLNNKMDENLIPKAGEMLEKALTLYPNSFGTYSVMFNYLIRDYLQHPENEEKDRKEIDKWLNQLKGQLKLYKGSTEDYAKNPIWKNFGGMENFLQQTMAMTTTSLLTLASSLEKQIAAKQTNIDLNTVKMVMENLFFRGYMFQFQPYMQRADEMFTKLVELKKADAYFDAWAFSIAMQFQKNDLLYSIGLNLRKAMPSFADPGYFLTMGRLAFEKSNNKDTEEYMTNFLAIIGKDMKANLAQKDNVSLVNAILDLMKMENMAKASPNKVTLDMIKTTIGSVFTKANLSQYKPYMARVGDLFTKLVSVKAKDTNFNNWAFQTALQLGKKDEAYTIAKNIEALTPPANNYSFYYTIAMLAYEKQKWGEAEKYMNKFLEIIGKDPMASSQQKAAIQQVQGLLKQVAQKKNSGQ
jgi:tetratricopeptide (TPR) repeat protein